jgi:hypothetical protein
MTYGDYKFYLPRPITWDRADWYVHQAKVREMTNWIHEQKWDHWGHRVAPFNEEFWFMVEENYNWFVLRWS